MSIIIRMLDSVNMELLMIGNILALTFLNSKMIFLIDPVPHRTAYSIELLIPKKLSTMIFSGW